VRKRSMIGTWWQCPSGVVTEQLLGVGLQLLDMHTPAAYESTKSFTNFESSVSRMDNNAPEFYSCFIEQCRK
jgi:hypothetical protein